MTTAVAKKIGSKNGVICIALGIATAQMIMFFFIVNWNQDFWGSFFWFTKINYGLNLIVGILLMLLSGYFYGQMAGVAILIKNFDAIWTGLLTGLAVLFTTAFLCGFTGYFQEGLQNNVDDPFFDYVLKPFYWISFFGLVPALVVGAWFGLRIKSHKKEII
ncbi:MAG: hypothetical protein RL757_2857 [Bacteroidota bacterium]|jgi:hypothetical protein